MFHTGLDILKILSHFFFNNNPRDSMMIALGSRTHIGEELAAKMGTSLQMQMVAPTLLWVRESFNPYVDML